MTFLQAAVSSTAKRLEKIQRRWYPSGRTQPRLGRQAEEVLQTEIDRLSIAGRPRRFRNQITEPEERGLQEEVASSPGSADHWHRWSRGRKALQGQLQSSSQQRPNLDGRKSHRA